MSQSCALRVIIHFHFCSWENNIQAWKVDFFAVYCLDIHLFNDYLIHFSPVSHFYTPCALSLRNRISCDHNFGWHVQNYGARVFFLLFFLFFQNFNFLRCYWSKKAKNCPKWQKDYVRLTPSSGNVHPMFVYTCKMIVQQFLKFFPNSNFSDF